jgi:hypothetical protein
MCKKYLITTFLLIIFGLISFNVSLGQINVHVSTARIQQLTPAQLDFENFQSSVLLFTIDITYPESHSVKLVKSQIIAMLKNGKVISMLEGDGFNSDPFNVTDHRSINNFNLGKSGEIKIHDFKITSEARKNILEPALATGKFPAGIYRFTVNVVDDSDANISDGDQQEIILESPSQIELRSPRYSEITNEFPFFEWTYDGQEVELTINEKSPDATPEDAISRLPFVYQNRFSGINSFQYPPGGVRHLQKGKTYVWRVTGKVNAAGGDQSVQSPLGIFKIEDDLQIMKRSELLDRLERIVGSKWKNIFEKIRERGFNPTENIYLNNQQLSNAELGDILNFLEFNSNNLENVTLE